MQISYDKEADTVAIWFQGVESYRTIDISEDIFIDIDENGRLAGVEIMHASEKFNFHRIGDGDYVEALVILNLTQKGKEDTID